MLLVKLLFRAMKVSDTFSLPYLDDVLRNAVSLPDKSELEYSLSQWNDCESTKVLNVRAGGVQQEYVLVEGVSALRPEQINEIKSSLLHPVFVVESKQRDTYGAFEKGRLDNFGPPERNNLSHLQVILKTLAQVQAKILGSVGDNEAQSEYALNDTAGKILDYFTSIDGAKVPETLEKCQVDCNKLLKSKLLLKSIWSPIARNVYVNKDSSKSLFLDISSQELLPPAYDALLYIFSLSDERFRQKHFEDLATLYFKSLAESLALENSKLHKEVTRSYTETQLATLLPIAKIKFASKLAETKPRCPQFGEIISNLSNYFRYPLIQQENIYEVVKTKLQSNNFSLLDFKIVPLTVKNGHMGEYFHLNISVKIGDKEQTLNLFAKCLLATGEMTKLVIESGVGVTEDFFYTILYKLFQDHGLQDIFDFAPKCYLSRLSGFIVLEDLSSLGYTSLQPNATLDEGSIRVVLEQLAKFHASTFIIEDRLSKQAGKTIRLGEKYAKYLEEKVLKYDKHLQGWYDGSVNIANWAIDNMLDLTENLDLSTDEVRKKAKEIIFCPLSRVKSWDKTKSVINHGDMYAGNMLIRFGQDQRAEDVVLIDFQVLRYVPPAYEVLFFIFLASTKEVRDQHLTELLNCYYECLSSHLKNYGLDIDEIFPRKHFDENIEYAKPAAIGMAFNYAQIIHTDLELREKITHDQELYIYYLSHVDELMELSLKSDHYKHILRGLLVDLIDLIKDGF